MQKLNHETAGAVMQMHKPHQGLLGIMHKLQYEAAWAAMQPQAMTQVCVTSHVTLLVTHQHAHSHHHHKQLEVSGAYSAATSS